MPSKAEGLGLPMIEGMICGSIPITCSDNFTAKEFSPKEFICDPNPDSIIGLKKVLWEGTEDWDELLLDRAAMSGKRVLSDFTRKTLAKLKQR